MYNYTMYNYGIANQTMNMSPTATKLVPVGSNSVQYYRSCFIKNKQFLNNC